MKKTLLTILSILLITHLFSQVIAPFSQEEVIYGRKSGMALTLLILTPENGNGKAVINLVSGGWRSSYNNSQGEYLRTAYPFINHGYTVFLVIHSSAPMFSINHQLGDILRSVQFVRYNAKKYNIDPDNIAIRGHSSGGHLSLLAATSNDIINKRSKDPISRVSSKVQAVVAFCPLTDFLNWDWGEEGILEMRQKKAFLQEFGVWGSFNYTKMNEKTKVFVPIESVDENRRLDSLLSPTHNVSKNDPPAYIIHGSSDNIVPIQQSKVFVDRYKNQGLEVVYVIKEGADHNLNGFLEGDYLKMFLWLDKKLKVEKK